MGSGAHVSLYLMGIEGCFHRGKAGGGLGTDQSQTSNVEVKNGEAIPPLPHTSS
jgi:hypothetical protein